MIRPGEVFTSLTSSRDNQASFIRGQRHIVEFCMSGRMVDALKSHDCRFGIDCSFSIHGLDSGPIPKVNIKKDWFCL